MLASLDERHRGALLLVSWDGLSIQDAATAAGVRPGPFRVRLHRARQALQPKTPTTKTARRIEEMS